MNQHKLIISFSLIILSAVISSCNKEVVKPDASVTLPGITQSLNSTPPQNGIWKKLKNIPSNQYYTGSVAVLMTDGSVLMATTDAQYNPSNVWFKLTPDSAGNYADGTWSQIASSNFSRHFFSSQVLPSGKLYVAGGEYGDGGNSAEIYDPVANQWTVVKTPFKSLKGYLYDSESWLLPNGNIVQNDIGPYTYVYNPTSNTWNGWATTVNGNWLDECTWVQLPDKTIVLPDENGQSSERYDPATNKWAADGATANNLFASDVEMGPGFLLPNNQVFFIGGNGNTAYYTPSGSPAPGAWQAGPVVPGGLGDDDAGGCFETNGKILMVAGPVASGANTFQAPTNFFEFDYTTNTYTAITAPGGHATLNTPTFLQQFLQLPNGQIFYYQMYANYNFVYAPGGSQIAAGIPTISSVTNTQGRNYAITGTVFLGLNTGACYGDDSQNASNYPIVRLVSGKYVYYAKTTNWTLTGSNSVNAQIPGSVPSGTYLMQVIVNGFRSRPEKITI